MPRLNDSFCIHGFELDQRKMSQQDMSSSEAEKPVASPSPQTQSWSNAPAPVWMQRLSIVILVVFCLYIGVLVFVLPWTRYWTQNPYMLSFTPFGQVMSSGFTRGLVSGLGLLDLWIGVSEIMHYHERRA
jgi:hypothetical protein